MTCPLRTEQTDLLVEYSAGRLDAARSVVLEKHLEDCPECSSFRTEQTAVWSALDLWEPAPVTVDFNRRLWQRIEAAAGEPWYKSLGDALRFADWKPLLPLTAAMLIIAAGFLFDHRGGGNTVRGVSGKEAEQVEQTLDDIQLLHELDAVSLTGGGNSKSM